MSASISILLYLNYLILLVFYKEKLRINLIPSLLLYFLLFITAWAAASLAIGTLYGEQDT